MEDMGASLLSSSTSPGGTDRVIPIVNQIASEGSAPAQTTWGGTVNIHGGNFMHVEGDYHHHTRFTSKMNEQGLNILLQHIAPEAMHNSAERYPPPKCHAETRKKILTELTNWIEQPQSDFSIFWVHAPAGHGKSAILQTITESFSGPTGKVFANFFFGRGKGKREQARYLFTTIAYQLALRVRGLRRQVDHIMKANPTLPTEDITSQVASLIINAFNKLAANEAPKFPFTVVIDGLDECSDPAAQQLILELVRQIVTIHRLPLRFLIASRPEPQILDVFNLPSLRGITRQVGTLGDDFKLTSDIEIFLRHGFSDIYRRKSHLIGKTDKPWPTDEVIYFFCAKASGQFIYATTVLKFIDDSFKLPGKQLESILSPLANHKNVFSDLDSLYFQILSTYPEPDALIRLLGFIVVIFTPVPAKVYEDLLNLHAGEVELILRGMHSLLDGVPHGGVNWESISIPHASFRDFLTEKCRSRQYYIDSEKFNSELVSAAFSLVSQSNTSELNISCQSLPDGRTVQYLMSDLWSHILGLETIPQSVLNAICDLETHFRKGNLQSGFNYQAQIWLLSSIGNETLDRACTNPNIFATLEDIQRRCRNLIHHFYYRYFGRGSYPLRQAAGIFVINRPSATVLADLFMLRTEAVDVYLEDIRIYEHPLNRMPLRTFLEQQGQAKELYCSRESRHLDVCHHFFWRFCGRKWSEIPEPSTELVVYLSQFFSDHFNRAWWGFSDRFAEGLEIPDFEPSGVSFNKAFCIWMLVKRLLSFLDLRSWLCRSLGNYIDEANERISDRIFRQILCITERDNIYVVTIREPFLTVEKHFENVKAIRALPNAGKMTALPFPFTTTPAELESQISSQIVSENARTEGFFLIDAGTLRLGRLDIFLADSRRAGNLYVPARSIIYKIPDPLTTIRRF